MAKEWSPKVVTAFNLVFCQNFSVHPFVEVTAFCTQPVSSQPFCGHTVPSHIDQWSLRAVYRRFWQSSARVLYEPVQIWHLQYARTVQEPSTTCCVTILAPLHPIPPQTTVSNGRCSTSQPITSTRKRVEKRQQTQASRGAGCRCRRPGRLAAQRKAGADADQPTLQHGALPPPVREPQPLARGPQGGAIAAAADHARGAQPDAVPDRLRPVGVPHPRPAQVVAAQEPAQPAHVRRPPRAVAVRPGQRTRRAARAQDDHGPRQLSVSARLLIITENPRASNLTQMARGIID